VLKLRQKVLLKGNTRHTNHTLQLSLMFIKNIICNIEFVNTFYFLGRNLLPCPDFKRHVLLNWGALQNQLLADVFYWQFIIFQHRRNLHYVITRPFIVLQKLGTRSAPCYILKQASLTILSIEVVYLLQRHHIIPSNKLDDWPTGWLI